MAEELGEQNAGLGAHLNRLDEPPDRVTVVNETDLPDGVVVQAVKEEFIENSSMAWGKSTAFQNYSGTGSMLTRREYRTPTNVIDEMRLARELAERDDDVAAAIGTMIATAFSDGMENFHEDERTVGLFNGLCREANMDSALKEMYREYLITSTLTTASLFTRDTLEWTPTSGNSREESVAIPLVGVLHAEDVRVLGDDTFGTAQLAYDPPDQKLKDWLRVFFADETSPAKKAEMGRTNRIAANMFLGRVPRAQFEEYEDGYYDSGDLYLLNPRMVQRSTMPKGNWKYPRPLLTRNFALLEAKRLLNIMDFALLQGGSNFIVVVKKGTDALPATPPEIANLGTVVRAASRTGVIVGDHRLSIDVITPDLKELLNPQKRRLVGRKLASALLRIPEASVEEPGAEGMKTEVELISRVIQGDRQDIKRHVERHIYTEAVRRNKRIFQKGAPKLWFPRIVLQGTQFFTDFVLKLRDRGDIPRKWAVEAAGFDYEAGVQQRQRELDAGDDEILIPGAVPHSSPEAGPQDNQEGRPPGGRDDRPRQTIQQNPGETVRAIYDEELGRTVRVGDITFDILEEFAETHEVGRTTKAERELVDSTEVSRRGTTVYVPVNPSYECSNFKAMRLKDGLSLIVGERRPDKAHVAKLICFRSTEYSVEEAEEMVLGWGYEVKGPASVTLPPAENGNAAFAQALASAVASQQAPVVNVEISNGRTKRIITRDEDGAITGSEEVPVDES